MIFLGGLSGYSRFRSVTVRFWFSSSSVLVGPGRFRPVPAGSGRFSDPLTVASCRPPPENAILAFGNGSDFRTGAPGQAGGSSPGQAGGPSAATQQQQQQQGPQATTGGASVPTETEPNRLRAQIPAQVSEGGRTGGGRRSLVQPSLYLQLFPLVLLTVQTASL